jgi:predicted NUDIX family phosphoesterase
MGSLDGSEHVLVVPADALDRLGRWRGFRPYPRSLQGEVLDALLERAFFLPRSEDLEHGERGLAFKQLVSYGLLIRRGSVFVFRRPAKGGDVRLQRKCSVGLGGHVNPVDASMPEGPADAGWPRPGPDCLARCMARELREEVAVEGLSLHLAGLLDDDSNDVGRRHLGVVYRCELGGATVVPARAEVEPLGWVPAGELAEPPGGGAWESWSAIAVAGIREIMGRAAAAARA